MQFEKNLFDHKRDWYFLEEYDKERNLVYKYHPLCEVWLTETERQQLKEELSRQKKNNWYIEQ